MNEHHPDLYSQSPDFYSNHLITPNNQYNNLKIEQATPATTYINMDSLSNNPMLTTASMPIPSRVGSANVNGRVLADLSEYVFDLETSQSPHFVQDISYSSSGNQNSGGTMFELQTSPEAMLNQSTIWTDLSGQNVSVVGKQESFQMDESEDIFQVDKADLIQSPTLAELNADNLYVDLLNIEDLIATEQLSPSTHLIQLDNSYSSGNHSAIHSSSLVPVQILQNHTPQTPNNSLQSNPGFYDELTNISSSPYDVYHTTPTRSMNSNATLSPGSHSSNSPSITMNSPATPPPPASLYTTPSNMSGNPGNVGLVQHNPKYTTLHELLMKKDHAIQYRERIRMGQSVPGHRGAVSPGTGLSRRDRLASLQQPSGSRLSSSAPTRLGLEQIWQRREPRPHLLSTGSLAEAGSTSSLSTAGVLSPEGPDFSQDEGYSDDDSHYDDFSSDDDSDNEGREKNSQSGGGSSSKNKRYFWQYNVQAKGPKGQRLVIKTQLEDPHVLNEITDPVFSPTCSVRGIKHSGKARKGDGNDLTPNPKKLNNIGKELDKLGRVINDMTPVSELPFNVRPKTRKEKNKLASRACRLKKKAQHEANKIKLYGLENEHKRLLAGISQMKNILAIKWQKPVGEDTDEINQQTEKVYKQASRLKIAGNSTEYVNSVLERYKSGNTSTALEEV